MLLKTGFKKSGRKGKKETRYQRDDKINRWFFQGIDRLNAGILVVRS